MSSLGDLLRGWHQGAQAVERGDWSCALRLFSDFLEPSARICFNVGCVHLLAGDPRAALRAFDQAVTRDTCLAVGFFQRGVANFQLERFPEALADFQLALVQLRDHAAINYSQLGLRFRLQAWEVLYNVAAAQCRLGLWAEAARSLGEATSKRLEGDSADLDAALDQVQRQVFLQLRRGPGSEVFRPPRRYLDYLEPVDFLGKATVIVPAVPGEQLPGVTQPQSCAAEEAVPGAAQRDQVTGAGSGPHGTPKTPADAEAGCDHLADGCTSIPCNEQRPHLEQVGQQAPLPPGLPAAEDPAGAQRTAIGDSESLVTVTVQCAFTVALKARRGADLGSLRALLSQALPRQAQLGQFSFCPAGQDGLCVSLGGEEALQRAWQDSAASPWGLQLQCRVAAQHGYSAQRPEDLAFQQGDIVDVLCEVDKAWLEGHRDGRIGIFPRCFVAPVGGQKPVGPSGETDRKNPAARSF
ncbi:NADPH oxidase activator 1 isoform X2 [Tamandua tetradactyla]|uniref:NADPH oxidase activator 1 isoform X2 n=1 Tax=Tamandua tetradactyla TaxID=48850 RepID=UPI004053F7C6